MTRPALRRLAPAAAALALALVVAGPAAASPETLKRAMSNVVFGPLDFVLSPVTAAYSLHNGLRDIDDSTGVRIVYPIPGYAWNTGTHAGASSLRALAGLLEMIPGVFLFFFETDLDPIYSPVERAEALVDIETPALYVKFGINYTAPASF